MLRPLFFLTFLVVCWAATHYEENSEEYQCVMCLCHARTGCYKRRNCADHSISEEYWNLAGGPKVDDHDNDDAYYKCMRDEDCIIQTIWDYTTKLNMDCNCDGSITCEDRLATHLFGRNCKNPQFGKTILRRFNKCSQKLPEPYPELRDQVTNC